MGLMASYLVLQLFNYHCNTRTGIYNFICYILDILFLLSLYNKHYPQHKIVNGYNFGLDEIII